MLSLSLAKNWDSMCQLQWWPFWQSHLRSGFQRCGWDSSRTNRGISVCEGLQRLCFNGSGELGSWNELYIFHRTSKSMNQHHCGTHLHFDLIVKGSASHYHCQAVTFPCNPAGYSHQWSFTSQPLPQTIISHFALWTPSGLWVWQQVNEKF